MNLDTRPLHFVLRTQHTEVTFNPTTKEYWWHFGEEWKQGNFTPPDFMIKGKFGYWTLLTDQGTWWIRGKIVEFLQRNGQIREGFPRAYLNLLLRKYLIEHPREPWHRATPKG